MTFTYFFSLLFSLVHTYFHWLLTWIHAVLSKKQSPCPQVIFFQYCYQKKSMWFWLWIAITFRFIFYFSVILSQEIYVIFTLFYFIFVSQYCSLKKSMWFLLEVALTLFYFVLVFQYFSQYKYARLNSSHPFLFRSFFCRNFFQLVS